MNYSMLVKMKENSNEHSESKLKSTPIAMVAPEMKQSSDNTEITKTCAVLGCDDSKNLNPEELFRFPEDASLRQIWTDLTGRNNWTPTDFSYICIQHFSVDCFECNQNDEMVLMENAVPSLKLPRHVLEVEYIEEDTLDNEDEEEMEEDYTDYEEEMETETSKVKNVGVNGKTYVTTDNSSTSDHVSAKKPNSVKKDNTELLKLFSQVQMMQRQVVGLKDKLKYNMKVHNRQGKFLNRLQQMVELKQNVLNQKRKKKTRLLLTLQDKIIEDTTGLVMAMPMRHTDDLKNFALSIYKYSPQVYIYVRNTLRTMLPSTEVLDSWLSAGYTPKNMMANKNLVVVSANHTDSELTCKVTLR